MSDEADMSRNLSQRSIADGLRQLYRDRGWRGIAILVTAVVTGLSLAALNRRFSRLGARIEGALFREMRVADQAHKASKHDSPEELLEMLECGIRDGWSDKVLRYVVLSMRRHAGDERVTRRLHQLIASDSGAHLRRAIAVVLGYAPTASGQEMLRVLRGDPDKAVREHAEMSLERLRRARRLVLRTEGKSGRVLRYERSG